MHHVGLHFVFNDNNIMNIKFHGTGLECYISIHTKHKAIYNTCTYTGQNNNLDNGGILGGQ